MTEGWDQSWGYADPAAAKAQGRVVVSMYLSSDSSKNMTAAHVLAYHAQGIGVVFNWESHPGQPLLGAIAGQSDALHAVALAHAIIAGVGYKPQNQPVIYFSCDTDINASQYPVIDGYYRAAGVVCHGNGFGVGAYGEADLVGHLAAAGLTDAEWQTLAWSGGRVDPAADFYQYSINNELAGASVDLDRIIHAAQLGAWWPPGAAPDSGGNTPLTEDEDVNARNFITDSTGRVAETDRIWCRLLGPGSLLQMQKDAKSKGWDSTIYRIPAIEHYGKVLK